MEYIAEDGGQEFVAGNDFDYYEEADEEDKQQSLDDVYGPGNQWKKYTKIKILIKLNIIRH